MKKIFGENIFTEKVIIDRDKYIGKGRPKLSDYISVIESQKRMNKIVNNYLDFFIYRFSKEVL